MNFNELVTHIKSEGCRVRIWRKKLYISGSGGTFEVTKSGPIINLATKGESLKKTITTLLHEYGHFLQWKEGFLSHIDGVCDAHTLHAQWLKGKYLTELERSIARNIMLWIEWDAEMRGYNLGLKLNINNFDSDYYLRGAIAYMISIKWSWDSKSDWKICIPYLYIKTPKIYTVNKLFAPLTRGEKILTKYIKS